MYIAVSDYLKLKVDVFQYFFNNSLVTDSNIFINSASYINSLYVKSCLIILSKASAFSF